ncbi:transglycosylase SLT domain-containing protein [Lysobacter sp. A378]
MSVNACFPRAAALLVVSLLVLVPLDAGAISSRDQAAVDDIHQRMQVAESGYRDALVKIGNADPAGPVQANTALEDMEDVVVACAAQRGCSVPSLLTSYERLLKLNADLEADEDLLVEESLAQREVGHHIAPSVLPTAPGTVSGDVPEAARAASLLGADNGHHFDRMVQYNPAVQEGIRRWLTDMRGAFLTSFENYQYMRHLMWPQYQRAGLPEALLFGILAKESNGRVHSTSRAGAAGPMQFMYATGQRFGLGDDGTGFDTRYDPYAASEASVAYLNERMGELNRDIELALAAYNGGEGRARRIHQANPGKSFWHEDVYHQFPPETRDYVPMVIAAAWLFLHPREYGLTLPKLDPEPSQLRLEQPASIYQLTICLGNRRAREGYMRVLRNLNPRYRADDWLPAGTVLEATNRIVGLYKRQCVDGRLADVARELVASDPAMAIVSGQVAPAAQMGPLVPAAVSSALPVAADAPRHYQVQRGETVASIAKKFQCDVGELVRANDIKGPQHRLRPGQSLALAGCRG